MRRATSLCSQQRSSYGLRRCISTALQCDPSRKSSLQNLKTLISFADSIGNGSSPRTTIQTAYIGTSPDRRTAPRTTERNPPRKDERFPQKTRPPVRIINPREVSENRHPSSKNKPEQHGAAYSPKFIKRPFKINTDARVFGKARRENPKKESTSSTEKGSTSGAEKGSTEMKIAVMREKKETGPREDKDRKMQTKESEIRAFEEIVEMEENRRFLTRSKAVLASMPGHAMELIKAKSNHKKLGFPADLKPARFIGRFPAFFRMFKDYHGRNMFGFTEATEKLLQQENEVMDKTEEQRMQVLRKLLMMSNNKMINMRTLFRCRYIFGLPFDLDERVKKYPQHFTLVEELGHKYLKLNKWDPALAVPFYKQDYLKKEQNAKKILMLPYIKPTHVKHFNEGMSPKQFLNIPKGLPLISPYSDYSELRPDSKERQIYKVCLVHEILTLSLEKRISLESLLRFRHEFGFKQDIIELLRTQSHCFYLAGSYEHCVIFLKSAYKGQELADEGDPLLGIKKKLHSYAFLKKDHPKIIEFLNESSTLHKLETKSTDKVMNM